MFVVLFVRVVVRCFVSFVCTTSLSFVCEERTFMCLASALLCSLLGEDGFFGLCLLFVSFLKLELFAFTVSLVLLLFVSTDF